MTDLFNISGKVALVTGGSKGIGYGIAEGLVKAGVIVVIANRNAEEGDLAAKRLSAFGEDVTSFQVDVGNVASVTKLIADVVAVKGHIDIVVNNAGAIARKGVLDINEDDYDSVIDTNMKGSFFVSQLAAKEMIKRGEGGRIINVTSITAEIVHLHRSVYASSKAGIAHMTRSMAYELGKHKITVNAIGPGMTFTEFNEQYWKDNPDQLKRVVSCIPYGRGGYATDYAGAVVFLSSKASEFMTGQQLLIDGGSFLSWAGS